MPERGEMAQEKNNGDEVGVCVWLGRGGGGIWIAGAPGGCSVPGGCRGGRVSRLYASLPPLFAHVCIVGFWYFVLKMRGLFLIFKKNLYFFQTTPRSKGIIFT